MKRRNALRRMQEKNGHGEGAGAVPSSRSGRRSGISRRYAAVAQRTRQTPRSSRIQLVARRVEFSATDGDFPRCEAAWVLSERREWRKRRETSGGERRPASRRDDQRAKGSREAAGGCADSGALGVTIEVAPMKGLDWSARSVVCVGSPDGGVGAVCSGNNGRRISLAGCFIWSSERDIHSSPGSGPKSAGDLRCLVAAW